MGGTERDREGGGGGGGESSRLEACGFFKERGGGVGEGMRDRERKKEPFFK